MNGQCKTVNEIKQFALVDGKLFTAFLLEISSCEEVCGWENLKKCAKTKKGHPFGWPFDSSKDLRSSRRFGLRGFFHFRRRLFAFDVALPAFSIFNFVGLLAHKCLYIGRVFRFCSAHYESLDTAIQHLFHLGGADVSMRLSNQPTKRLCQRVARSYRSQSGFLGHKPSRFSRAF